MPHDTLNAEKGALAKLPQRGYVTLNGKQHLVHIAPVAVTQQPDPRPAQYITAKERGLPAQTPRLPAKAPSVLAIALSAVIAMSFLVAASMFSISLTAYSNSVDRVDAQRAPIRLGGY
jgi:hypothetical protein